MHTDCSLEKYTIKKNSSKKRFFFVLISNNLNYSIQLQFEIVFFEIVENENVSLLLKKKNSISKEKKTLPKVQAQHMLLNVLFCTCNLINAFQNIEMNVINMLFY